MMSILKKHYLQPAFLICVIVLALGAAGMSVMVRTFGVVLAKEPIHLKASFDDLDQLGDLGRYEVVRKMAIENDEVLKSLGTEDYLQWILVDTEADNNSPVKYSSLFITFYGIPDQVPHIPEECFTGGGHELVRVENVDFDIDLSTDRIPGRYLIFSGTTAAGWGREEFPVLYMFRTNDEYVGGRDGVRLTLNRNIFGKHSYFSKVEWKFFNSPRGTMIYPDKEEAIKASEKLLEVLLPLLEKNHWPTITDNKNDDIVEESI